MPKKHYFTRFGLLPLNNHERRFSQPKLELYSLYQTLCAYKMFLVSVRNLIVEVNARYIKGMLNNPDIVPSASINQWIVSILTFHFKLRHFPGKVHGPDRLLWRPPQPNNDSNSEESNEEAEDFEDWIDNLYGFIHMVNWTVVAPWSEQFMVMLTLEKMLEHLYDIPDPQSYKPNYNIIPRTTVAASADKRLEMVHKWLEFLERLDGMSDQEHGTIIHLDVCFFLDNHILWKQDLQGAHKQVLYWHKRIKVIHVAHDDMGHRGFYATQALVIEWYWWPFLRHDIAWYIQTCHICQTHQTQQVSIPPVIATLAPLFAKMYKDMMHLLCSGRCLLTSYPEFRMLRKEMVQALSNWIFQDVLCQWGTLTKIVSDNGKPFITALTHLEHKYHVKHIRISSYNSCANGIVKWSHFNIWQTLFKVADREQNCWLQVTYLVFWSKCVTPCKCMGCSPFFATTGAHPLLPFDIVEANYPLPPPDSILSTTNLIARRAIALQKRQGNILQPNFMQKFMRHATMQWSALRKSAWWPSTTSTLKWETPYSSTILQ